MSNVGRLWVLILLTAILMAAVGVVEARPTDWIFTGYFQVEDPSGNPAANAPVAMDGYTL
jgi:hypothetical protein